MSAPRAGRHVLSAPLTLILFVMGLGSAACQSAAFPTDVAVPPAPTLDPTPTPSAVPTLNEDDIERSLADLIRTRGVPLQVEYSGEIILGDLDFRLIKATLADAGDEERADVHIAVGEVERHSSIIRTGGQSFLKEGDLPWVRLGPEALRYDVFDIFDGVEDVTVRDAPRDSGDLYHLVPVNEVTLTPDVLNLNLSGYDAITILATTFNIWTDVNGVPVSVELALHIEGEHAGEMVLGEGSYTYEFEGIGQPVTIELPDGPIWTRFRSDRSEYSIAHPEDWVAEEAPSGMDRFSAPWGDYLLVSRFPVGSDMTVDAASAGVIENYQPLFGGINPVSTREATIDGGEARIINFLGDFAFAEGTAPLHLLAAVLIRDGMGYELTLIAEPGMEDLDQQLFDDFIATFDSDRP